MASQNELQFYMNLIQQYSPSSLTEQAITGDIADLYWGLVNAGTVPGPAMEFANATTSTVAPAAGGAGALPATPKGYITVSINGTSQQVAYY